jgi:hypothetical protein
MRCSFFSAFIYLVILVIKLSKKFENSSLVVGIVNEIE